MNIDMLQRAHDELKQRRDKCEYNLNQYVDKIFNNSSTSQEYRQLGMMQGSIVSYDMALKIINNLMEQTK